MADIFNGTTKAGSVNGAGDIYNKTGQIGRVRLDTGEVFDKETNKVGYYQSDGYVYDYNTHHVGTVHGDGMVYNYDNNQVGSVKGEPIQAGGAALLLLLK